MHKKQKHSTEKVLLKKWMKLEKDNAMHQESERSKREIQTRITHIQR